MTKLPQPFEIARDWTWDDYAAHYESLKNFELNAKTIDDFIRQWDGLQRTVSEVYGQLAIKADQDTTDEAARDALMTFVREIVPKAQTAQAQLQKKLVDSGLQPEGLEPYIYSLHGKLAVFREENLPLETQEEELNQRYSQIMGAQSIEWDGEERTLQQMIRYVLDPDRDTRETAWMSVVERRVQDEEAINEIWRDLLGLRKTMYENADQPDFRSFAWRKLGRVDYKPEDAIQYCESIEKVVVPAVNRIMEGRREKLGLDELRPWDTNVDPDGREPLKPYETVEEFITKTTAIFKQVDPELGEQFAGLDTNRMLDLDNRKGKGPGGYCATLPVTRSPFIFMNGTGLEYDVNTILHEAGHAFHALYMMHTPHLGAYAFPIEFGEVASMSMELLAAPYLTEDKGGYFNEADAARYRIKHLKSILALLPWTATMELFQHWVYENHDEAMNPAACNAKWGELRKRFAPHINWEGLENYLENDWRRVGHYFIAPFYMIEYAMAQLGAIQVWANALEDQTAALEAYRGALKLGFTVPLPQLYEAAGAKFAFDVDTIQAAVDLVEKTIAELEALEQG